MEKKAADVSRSHSRSSYIVLVLSLGALACSLVWLVAALVATHRMTRAEGVVVGYEQGERGLRSYQPVISFTTASGESEHVIGSTSSTKAAYDVGQHVRVLYEPTDPLRSAVIDDFEQRWFPIGVVSLLSTVFAAIGVTMYVTERNRFRQVPSKTVARLRSTRNRQNLAISVTPIAIGTAFLVGAAALALHEKRIISSYTRTSGHVLSVQEVEQPYQPRSHLYSAIVAFKTDTGREVRFAQGASSSHMDLYTGDEVGVLYDKKTPDRAMIDSFWEHWGVPAVLFIIGLPFFAVGVYFVATVKLNRGRTRSRA